MPTQAPRAPGYEYVYHGTNWYPAPVSKVLYVCFLHCPASQVTLGGRSPWQDCRGAGEGVDALSIFSHGFLCGCISVFICKPSLVKSEVLQRMVLFSRRCVFLRPNQFQSPKRLGAWQHDSRQTQPAGGCCPPGDRCLWSHRRGGWAVCRKLYTQKGREWLPTSSTWSFPAI